MDEKMYHYRREALHLQTKQCVSEWRVSRKLNCLFFVLMEKYKNIDNNMFIWNNIINQNMVPLNQPREVDKDSRAYDGWFVCSSMYKSFKLVVEAYCPYVMISFFSVQVSVHYSLLGESVWKKLMQSFRGNRYLNKIEIVFGKFYPLCWDSPFSQRVCGQVEN